MTGHDTATESRLLMRKDGTPFPPDVQDAHRIAVTNLLWLLPTRKDIAHRIHRASCGSSNCEWWHEPSHRDYEAADEIVASFPNPLTYSPA